MADLEKLVAYQSQALTETDREIERIEQMAAEYERLSRTLICLPKRLAHEALVPLCKRACAQGMLVRTNEVFVLLGAETFLHCSVSHASGIAERRLNECKERLGQLQEQRRLIAERVRFERTEMNPQDDVVEIHEPFEEEEESEEEEAVATSASVRASTNASQSSTRTAVTSAAHGLRERTADGERERVDRQESASASARTAGVIRFRHTHIRTPSPPASSSASEHSRSSSPDPGPSSSIAASSAANAPNSPADLYRFIPSAQADSELQN